MAIADRIENEIMNMDRARVFIDNYLRGMVGFYRMVSLMSRDEEKKVALDMADHLEEIQECVYTEKMKSIIARALDESRYYQEQMH